MSAAGAVVVGPKVNGLAAEGAALVDEFLEFLDGHVDWCLWLTELRAVEGNKELLRLVAWEKRQSKRRLTLNLMSVLSLCLKVGVGLTNMVGRLRWLT